MIEKRKVKCSIDADNIACLRNLCIATNKLSNFLLAVIDLTKGEKVLFADTERKFAYRIGKIPCKVGTDILQGINTEAINIVPGNNILVCTNQNIANWIAWVTGTILEIAIHLLHREKVVNYQPCRRKLI